MSSGSLVPPMLVPSSLYKEEAKRDSTRIRIYNMVLQQIYNKVKAVARVPGNEKSLWYVVPEFIPGTPRFDIGDAVLYIVWNLRIIGYTVEYSHPNLLIVSWRSHDEIYRKHESPLSQVLNAVRGVAQEYKVPMAKPTIPTAMAPMPEITKRKTPIKKTVEFKPEAETIHLPSPTQPMTRSLVMSATGGAGAGIPRLPGQLSERHVSFV
jgi:hypothetical protein